MNYKEAQTWLNALEERSEGMPEAQKKERPRLLGGLSLGVVEIDHVYARLTALCEQYENHSGIGTVFKGELWD